MTQLPSLKDEIKALQLSANKALGQNFLLDPNLTDKLARMAYEADPLPFREGTLFEIGPGPGGFTRSLLKLSPKTLIAIEKDERCAPILARIHEAYPAHFSFIIGSAIDFNFTALGDAPRAVLGNLPYNVATPILIQILKSASAFRSLTLMFQKEVAERLTAMPSTSAYGRLSVLVQFLAEARTLTILPPAAFTPAPKVHSALVHLCMRPQPIAPIPLESLERVTLIAFNQRRKMLRSALKPLGDAEALCAKAEIDSSRRAETLSVHEFCALAKQI